MQSNNVVNVNKSMFIDLNAPSAGGGIFLESIMINIILNGCYFKKCSAFGTFSCTSRGIGSGGGCFIEAKNVSISYSFFLECFGYGLGSSSFLFTYNSEKTDFSCNSDSRSNSSFDFIFTCGVAFEGTTPFVEQFNSSYPQHNFMFGMLHVVLSPLGTIKYSLFMAGDQKIQSAMDFSYDNVDIIDVLTCVVSDTDCEQAPITAPESKARIRDSFFIRCRGMFPTNSGTLSEVSGCYYSKTLSLNEDYKNVMHQNFIYNNEPYILPYCNALNFIQCSNEKHHCQSKIYLALALADPSSYLISSLGVQKNYSTYKVSRLI